MGVARTVGSIDCAGGTFFPQNPARFSCETLEKNEILVYNN